MTLRLDNAGALPTGPQPHEQQQALVWGIWCQAVSVDMALDLTKVALAGAWSPPFGPRRAGRASTLSLQAAPDLGNPRRSRARFSQTDWVH